jgi:hypothetical protein
MLHNNISELYLPESLIIPYFFLPKEFGMFLLQ